MQGPPVLLLDGTLAQPSASCHRYPGSAHEPSGNLNGEARDTEKLKNVQPTLRVQEHWDQCLFGAMRFFYHQKKILIRKSLSKCKGTEEIGKVSYG